MFSSGIQLYTIRSSSGQYPKQIILKKYNPCSLLFFHFKFFYNTDFSLSVLTQSLVSGSSTFYTLIFHLRHFRLEVLWHLQLLINTGQPGIHTVQHQWLLFYEHSMKNNSCYTFGHVLQHWRAKSMSIKSNQKTCEKQSFPESLLDKEGKKKKYY